VISLPSRERSLKGLGKLINGFVLPEEVSLFPFDPLFESQNHFQLLARVVHLARIDFFEE
jgi:hypothetical protein